MTTLRRVQCPHRGDPTWEWSRRLPADEGAQVRERLDLIVNQEAKPTDSASIAAHMNLFWRRNGLMSHCVPLAMALDASLAAGRALYIVGPEAPYFMKHSEIGGILDVPPLGMGELKDVQRILAEALPLGGRAIIVADSGENSHAFNAVKTDDGVLLMDAGTGTTFQTQDEVAAYQKGLESAPDHGDIEQVSVYVTTPAAELPATQIRRLILEWRENQRQASSSTQLRQRPDASQAAALDL